METLEQVRSFFENDRFAKALGIEIERAEPGLVRCGLSLRPEHLNAMGQVHGGVIGTLADFTFAVAANLSKAQTVTLNSSIHYIGTANAGRLHALGQAKKATGHISVFEVQVFNQQDTLLALGTFTGYSKKTL